MIAQDVASVHTLAITASPSIGVLRFIRPPSMPGWHDGPADSCFPFKLGYSLPESLQPIRLFVVQTR